jgi:hypothetical protein
MIVVTEGTRFPSCVRYPALGVGIYGVTEQIFRYATIFAKIGFFYARILFSQMSEYLGVPQIPQNKSSAMLENMTERQRLDFVVSLCNQRISPLASGLQITEDELTRSESRANQQAVGWRCVAFDLYESHYAAA